MDDALLLASATAQIEALRARQVSARELLDAAVGRVERFDGALNAVVTLDVAAAQAAAAAVDRTRMHDPGALGALAGLPVTIKDALETAGLRSTGGARELHDHVPHRDAPAVAAVRGAGAVLYGKTNLPKWSGDVQTFNDLFGTTNNPWDPARTPGGSSGGAAVAVACGFSSFELGTDIGGSIRLPAGFCGIWGHKPSWGLVPSLGYLDHAEGGTIEADVNVVGPLARSVDDLELLVDLLAGPSPERAKAWRVALPPSRLRDPGRLRVAAWLDEPSAPVSAEVAAVLERGVAALEASGVPVDRLARPPIDFAAFSELAMELITLATLLDIDEDVFGWLDRTAGPVGANRRDVGRGGPGPAEPPPGGPDERQLASYRRLTRRHRDWLIGHRTRQDVRRRWAEFFEHHDVLLAPNCVSVPFHHDQQGGFSDRLIDIDGTSRPYLDLVRWTSFIGAAYLPVTTTPLGFSAGGLPVGIQVVGPYLEDRTTMAVGRLLAEVAGGGYRPPPAVATAV